MAKRTSGEKQFSFVKWGVMGTFETAKSLPVEFLLTSISIDELDELTFANSIDPEHRDFELLMQRDIDMDRVQREIMSYLNPDKSDGELLSRPIFFPPLLAAVIPTIGTKIEASLPPASVKIGTREGGEDEYLQRSWGNIFRLSYFQSENDNGIPYQTDDGKKVIAETTPVCLEVKQTKELGDTLGVRLVVFDGQHRLMALLKLAIHNKAAVAGISVPVAIVWSPNSTLEVKERHQEAYRPVYEVFRRLFVDVNKNAIAVGGHFNTLLSDSDVGSVAMRIMCECVLETYTETGLALVEWNIRSKKDASQIRRDYSLTSIGVIDIALRKALAGRQRSGLLKHVLALGGLEAELYPNDANYSYPKPVEYDKFSPSQRVVLEGAIRERLVKQGLVRLFFETEQFVLARNAFEQVVSSYRSIVEKHEEGYESCSAVLRQVLDYRPFEKGNEGFISRERKFWKDVSTKYGNSVNGIIRYAVFQRAMVDTWLSLIDTCRDAEEVDLQNVTDAYISLLNHALKKDRALFSETAQRYMKHSVFRSQGRIKPTEGTRKALGHLLLAGLGNEAIASKFVSDAGLVDKATWKARFIDVGMEAATAFAGHLRRECIADFVATYATDFSIPQAEREDLAKAESLMRDLKAAVRNENADKNALERATIAFEKAIDNHVRAELETAIGDLKDMLGYKTDIVFDTRIEDDDGEEDSNGTS